MKQIARTTLLAALWLALPGCADDPAPVDADVIVIGAGIAGLSAALEASDRGADVLLIEASSMPGGHAVKAGGFALVGTPLQNKKGHADSPNIAFRDLMAWGEDADADWVRYFVDHARTDIHDWLTGFGVNFNILLDTPEDTVPRFHFAGGTAVNVIVPMLREAFRRNNIRYAMNARVEAMLATDFDAIDILARDTRSDASRTYRAPAIVLATGGFQNNLDFVRDNWPERFAVPERMLLGAGHFADGDGIRLGREYGAAVRRMSDQVIFVNGLPNPREPSRGLHPTNPASIWVDTRGRRFINEDAVSKAAEAAGLALTPQTHWMIFDAEGRRKLRLRGAEWLNAGSIADEILANPNIVSRANTIEALATAAGLPAAGLATTVERYNEAVAAGTDDEFQREMTANSTALATPPYYALQLWPMTRKSLGGIAIDLAGRVLSEAGDPVAGLFAAGELTGVAGINGSHGGSGTFLAPSVLTGRVAGRGAAEHAGTTNTTDRDSPTTDEPPADGPMLTTADLRALLATQRDGYWHFERSHAMVLERDDECARCHRNGWPTMAARHNQHKRVQIDSCTHCH